MRDVVEGEFMSNFRMDPSIPPVYTTPAAVPDDDDDDEPSPLVEECAAVMLSNGPESMACVSTWLLAIVSCMRREPSQLVDARRDDEEEVCGRYWRAVMPSLGGEGRDIGSGGGCAMMEMVGSEF